MVVPSAVGHGTSVGTNETRKDINMVKHILQYYWQTAKIYPYEKSKAWYFGPKLDWMKEVKERKKNEKPSDGENFRITKSKKDDK